MPLSGTMKPKPLETSNHLMTPASSMRVPVVSSVSSLTVPGRRLVPDIFDSTPSDAMTPRAAALLAPLPGAATNLSAESKITPALKRQRAKCACAQVCTQRSGWPNQLAMKGASASPMSSRTTRSAMSSNSVGSRLMMTSAAPLRLAIKGKPAAGHTTSEEPIDKNRSQSRVNCSARSHRLRRHRLAERDRRGLDVAAAVAIRRAARRRLNLSLTHASS